MADKHARSSDKDIESMIDVGSDRKQERARVPITAMPTVRGNPGPLGLLGFGMTTCMLMFVQTTWGEAAFKNTVVGYAFIYGGLLQLLAGLFELVRGNTFGATAFCSYGCFWIGWAIGGLLNATQGAPSPSLALPAGHFVTGETLYLCLWGTFSLLCTVVTLRKNHCLMFIFSSLTATFYLLAMGQRWPDEAGKAAGYVGFVCGASAIYLAFAEVYEETLGIRLPGLAPVKYI